MEDRPHHSPRASAREPFALNPWLRLRLVALGLSLVTLVSHPATAAGGWGDMLPGLGDLMPTVDVTLTHPPSLGLDIDRVAFAPGKGRCVGEFVDLLMSRFIDNGVKVIERERMKQLLDEHDLSISGYIDPEDAIAMGQLLGPAALIFVEETRCDVDKSQRYETFQNKDGNSYRVYYAKTEVSFGASLRIVALESGRVFTAKTFDATQEEVVKGRNQCPAYPPEHGPQRLAVHWAAEQAHRMFFPWTETKELRFFKGKKCNLTLAYRMLQIGDLEGAAEQSEQSLEQCEQDPRVKPKTLARAHYNLGMSRFIQGDHQGALEHLEKAHRIKPGPRIREAVLECKQAEKESLEMQQFESRIATSPTVPSPAAPPRAFAQAGPSREDAYDRPPAIEGQDDRAQDRPAPQDQRSVMARLEELDALLAKGLIGAEAYEAKRNEILEDL